MSMPLVSGAEHAGRWWLPQTPELTADGLLRCDEHGGISLTTLGPPADASQLLTGTIRFEDLQTHLGAHDPQVVHGNVNGTPVTLWHCLTLDAGPLRIFSANPDAPAVNRLHVHQVVTGGHVASQDQFLVRDVAVRSPAIDNIMRGMGAAPYAAPTSGSRPRPSRALRRVVMPKLTIHFESWNNTSHTAVDQATRSWSEAQIRLRFKSKVPFGTIATEEGIRPLQALLNFSQQATSTFSTVRVRTAPTEEWMTIQTSGNDIPLPANAWMKQILQISELKRPTASLSAWWELSAKQSHAIANYMGLLNGGTTHLQQELLLAATAIEGLGVKTKTSHLPPQIAYRTELKNLKSRLSAAEAKWLDTYARPPYFDSYRDQALSLSRELPQDIRNRFLPDEAIWADRLKQVRNDLAHALENYARYTSEVEYLLGLLSVTRLVISNALLVRMQANNFANRLEQHLTLQGLEWSGRASYRL